MDKASDMICTWFGYVHYNRIAALLLSADDTTEHRVSLPTVRVLYTLSVVARATATAAAGIAVEHGS